MIWTTECMKIFNFSRRIFTTNCFQLVKMVSLPKQWPVFLIYLEEFWHSKTFFPTFKIRHIPKVHNLVVDKLALDGRSSLYAMFYVDFMLPVWLAELVRHTLKFSYVCEEKIKTMVHVRSKLTAYIPDEVTCICFFIIG